MSKFSIEYVIEAADINTAAVMAHDNVYLADLEVEKVTVRPVSDPEDNDLLTYADLPTETNPKVYARLHGRQEPGFGDVE